MLSTWIKRGVKEKPMPVTNDQAIFAPVDGHRIYYHEGRILYRITDNGGRGKVTMKARTRDGKHHMITMNSSAYRRFFNNLKNK